MASSGVPITESKCLGCTIRSSIVLRLPWLRSVNATLLIELKLIETSINCLNELTGAVYGCDNALVYASFLLYCWIR